MERVSSLLAAAVVVALALSAASLVYVASLSGKLSQLSEEQRALANRTGSLEDVTADVVKALGDVEDALRGLQASMENVKAALESQGAAAANLTDAVKGLDERLSLLESSLAELQPRLATVNSTLGEEVASLRELVASLRAKLESTNASIASLSKDLADLQRGLEELSSRLSSLEEVLYYPVTVVDASGDQVTLYKRPEKIVSLAPSVTEILFAVGAGGQVVGVDDYSNYPPEVVEAVENGTIARVGGPWTPSLEAILALNPDLVIGVASIGPHSQVKEALSRYGIPVVLLPNAAIEDVYESIVMVGMLTGHRVEAAALAAEVEEAIYNVSSIAGEYKSSTGTGNLSVALIVWINPIWVAGSGTFQNDIIVLAGGVNAFNEVQGWASVSPEDLLAANPDVIIATGGHGAITYDSLMEYLKDVLGDAAYNITAVREGRVYVIHGWYEDALNRPGPRVYLAVELLAALIYPEAFGIDPAGIPHDVTPDSFPLPQLGAG